MLADRWQDGLIDELRALLEPDPGVRALVLFGSSTVPELRDVFSDVDVMLVAADGAASRFFPACDWLRPLGTIFATERSTYERSGVHRVCYEDGRRLDVVVVEEHVIADIQNWAQHPLRSPRHTIFSRSPATDHAVATMLEGVPARPPSRDEFAARVNAFWFEAQLAVHKAVRGDLLVASHLQFGLARSCMELAMMLRDRSARTRYHRHGHQGDAALLTRLQEAQPPHEAANMIDAIEGSAKLFDELAPQWDAMYERRLPTLDKMLQRARAARTPHHSSGA